MLIIFSILFDIFQCMHKSVQMGNFLEIGWSLQIDKIYILLYFNILGLFCQGGHVLLFIYFFFCAFVKYHDRSLRILWEHFAY